MSSHNSPLAGLDDIDWHNLQHAYGAADDVPDLLLSLSAGDDSVIEELCGNIHHQGGVYQATAHAIPFLWRLLARPGNEGHPGIAVLLSSIAEASSNNHSAWSEKCRDAVWSGNAVALHLLSTIHETARRGAVSILACFPENTAQLEAPFRAVLHRPDCSDYESARLGLALAALGFFEEAAFPPGAAAFFTQAKHLAQETVAGNPEALRTCLSILTETIDRNPKDLSDWTA